MSVDGQASRKALTRGRSQIEGLLDSLPGIIEAQPEGNRCAFGAAVKGAIDGLVSTALWPISAVCLAAILL